MKGVRPFEDIVSEEFSDTISGPDATFNLELELRKRQNEGVELCLRAFHVILQQEATTHNEEVTMKAKEQFHLCCGADQLISAPHNHFESGSSIIESELRRTSSSACSRTHTRKCDVSRRDVCPNDLLTPRTGSFMFPNLMLHALPRAFRTAWC